MCNVLCTSLGPTLYKRKELWKTRVNWPCSWKKRALIWICVQSQCYCFFSHPTPNSTLCMTAICNKRLIRMRELQSFVLVFKKDSCRWKVNMTSEVSYDRTLKLQGLIFASYNDHSNFVNISPSGIIPGIQRNCRCLKWKKELQTYVWRILFFPMPHLVLITITSRFHLDPGTVSDKTLHR